MLKALPACKAAIAFTVLMLAGANCLMEVGTVADFMGSPNLEYTHGIRASVFALVAASWLFITLLPKSGVEWDDTVDAVCRICSVVAAFLAGLFWLLDETGGDYGPYVTVLSVVAGGLAGIIAFFAVVGAISEWWSRRGKKNAV